MFARRGAVRCDGRCPYLRRGARTRWPFHDRRRAHAARLAKVSRVKWARDVTQVPRDPDSSVGPTAIMERPSCPCTTPEVRAATVATYRPAARKHGTSVGPGDFLRGIIFGPLRIACQIAV